MGHRSVGRSPVRSSDDIVKRESILWRTTAEDRKIEGEG